MNPFAVLGVAARFDVDMGEVERKHRELSRAFHPDRHLASEASVRKDTLQKAIEVNEAFRVVRDPVRRAEALFRAAGIEVGEGSEPRLSPSFLAQMMEDREALADAKGTRNLAAVHRLADEIKARDERAKATLAPFFTGAGVLRDGLALLGQLRFYQRFMEEVDRIEDEMAGDRLE